MKKTSRWSSLALLLCIAALISCGETADTPTEKADTDPVPEITETEEVTIRSGVPEDFDLGGETIHLWYTDNWPSYTDIAGSQSGDILDDAVYSQNLAVQERLNCIIDFFESGVNQSECNEAISKLLLANDTAYDVYCPTQWSGALVVPQGLYMNIADMPYLSLDEPWWDSAYMKEITMGNDCLYTLVGDCTIDRTRYLSCCYYNKLMYQEYYENADGMYRTVLDGDWTHEALKTMCTEVFHDLDGNGKTDKTDIIGTTLCWNQDIMALQYCTDARLTERNENNCPYLVINSEKMADIVSDIGELAFGTSGILYGTEKEDIEIIQASEKFAEGTMLFLFGQLQTAEYLRDMKQDYGVIPTPKYDREQENYYSYMFEVMRFMALPYNCQKAESVCAMLEEMAFEGYETVRPVYYETVLKNKYARDDLSAQMIDLVHDGLHTDIALVYLTNWAQVTLLTRDTMKSTKKPVDFASRYAKLEQRAVKEGEKLIEQFLENRE